MKKLLLLAVIGLSTLAFSARAQFVGFSVGYHGVSVGVAAPAPAYYASPAPVYSPPAAYYPPAYYAAPPVVYAPAPAYYYGPRVVVGGYWGPYYGWHGHYGHGWHGGHWHH